MLPFLFAAVIDFSSPYLNGVSLERIKDVEMMVKNEQPFLILNAEKNGRNKTPVLSYNLPESTSYRTRNYIILNRPKLLDENSDWWNLDQIPPYEPPVNEGDGI
ncbi:MAG TPA: hypothetical protein VKA91_08300 [Nitrososphaeraceae archaeon]|nr:hypothetical protein [Nitrososphaeraceae archaeon]